MFHCFFRRLTVLIGVCIFLRHHRLRTASRALGRQETEGSEDSKDSFIAVKVGCKGSVIQTLDPEKEAGTLFLGLRSGWKRETGGGGRTRATTTTKRKGPEDESHTTFLELLKLSRAKPAKEARGGHTVTSSGVSAAVITSAGVSGSKDIALVVPTDHQYNHLPGEDLRNYAYEGDGSSSGSLASTISGLRTELEHEEPGRVIAAEFVEVMDLLKNLPEAPKSSILLARLKEKRTSAKGVGDPEVMISTVPLGSLRSKENCQISSSSSSPPAASSGSFPRPPKDMRKAEMPSSSKGGPQAVCRKDELTTAC